MSSGSRPLRARSALEKARRRSEILSAAERLWEHSSYTDLSMHHVAKEAKLAKGTLYLYFDTKEELFMALLSEKVGEWLTELADRLEENACQTVSCLAQTFAEVAERKKQTRRLLLLLSAAMGRMPAESIQEFRRELKEPYERLITLLPYERALGAQVLLHTYALVSGWQQVSDHLSGIPDSRWHTASETSHLALALEGIFERFKSKAGA